MSAERHPEEPELLAYAEGDLAGEDERAIREHVGGCPRCAGQVRRLEQARAALRAAPLLELPPRRREAIVAELPARPRRQQLFSPRRLAAVLAAAALAAGAVAVLSTGDGGRVGGGAGEEEAAEVSSPPAGEEAGPGGGRATTLSSPRAPVTSVRGPATRVAERLRERGFEARVAGGAVEVRNARREAVASALRGLPRGGVDVYVR